MAGLNVLLCDLSLDTLGLDRSSLNELIDYSILAIIAVHPFGLVEDMHDLVAIGKQQDIFIIEDAAQSLGARLDQQVVGSWGDISIFSLGRGKVITAGGGGIITTSNQEIAAALDAVIENEVKSPKKAGLNSLALLAGYLVATQPSIWWFIVKSPLNPALESRTAPVESFSFSNLSASQTGIGHSMMVKLEQINKIRRRNAERLIKALSDLPAVRFPGQIKNSEPIYLRLPVLLDNLEARELLFEQLNSNGIGVSRMYEQPLARTFVKEIDQQVEELPVSDYIAQHLLTLPTHHMLADDDFSKTIEIFYKQLAV
jgi:dTDP-4-amino-4,6-dideoxygalactose transaminase